MRHSYQLTAEQSDYLVARLRQTNGAAMDEVAARLKVTHPRYVWILYRRITGKTFTEDGYGNARRWKFMKPDAEILPTKGNHGRSRIPKGEKPCPGCEILIPVEQDQCKDCGKPFFQYQDFDPHNPYRCPLGRVYRPQ